MASPVSYACLYLLMLGSVAHCDFIKSHFGAYLPGDIVLGIVGSVHSKVQDLESRISPGWYTCTDFDQIPFLASLVVFHTIEEINNSSFLPGIKLGYLMCDACVYGTKALDCVERMLAVDGPPTLLPDYSNFSSPIKAILGERYSELSIPIAKLLSLYMIPQTQALVKLISHYSWNWVGVVTLDDDYGRALLENFVQDAQKEQVCLQYQKVLPNYLGLADIEEKIMNVADQIESSNATVVLLILRPELVQMIFQEMIKRNVSRVWIASDAWSTTRFLMMMKDINKVGDIFGFTFMSRDIPGFEDYMRDIRPSPGAWNDFITEYKQMRSNCTQQSQDPTSLYCNSTDDIFLLRTVDLTEAYSQRLAVYAIAHAIKKLLKCDDASCTEDPNFLPWKLINILRNMKFTVDNQTYSFNKQGDFENGYDLIMWKRNGDKREIDVVGKYLISSNNIDVYTHKISWFNNTVPESRCSKRCPPGTHKHISNITCCYVCINCVAGEYSDKEGRARETEPIVFSMLFHLFAWLCFIPFFVTLEDRRPSFQLSAIMLSNYGVMLGHFSPKWFRIFSEINERNTNFHPASS
ncbi:G-protein coupled receptor family C group 6 member A [Bagarius yarrelli]|uniref:G-protein coupled receptor family C group 6 member A n=1 Tax=Bagarius yarrelli TaxID=175774 RepID=A0A556TSL1_BAGYA|nr:G-protein coupled receptor family C group 6 member A [Bagarius yarrelli]